MDPATSVRTAEQALRDLIAHVLSRALGHDWLDRAVPAEKLTEWRGRQQAESGKRPGHTLGGVTELSYAYLGDLTEIVLSGKFWSSFESALGSKRELEGLLTQLHRVRRPVAHSRSVLPFEEELASGVAGLLRNRVTIYLSSQDPAGDYYPRIESVEDNLGNTWHLGPDDDVDRWAWVQTGLTVRVGDTLTYRCQAFDPGGRTLRWRVASSNNRLEAWVEGDEVELTWVVEPAETGRDHATSIVMTHEGLYHRNVAGSVGADGYVVFLYTVLPPVG